MPQPAIPIPDRPDIRRPTTRRDRKAIGMSALVLFASITVVGGWGLDGFQASSDTGDATAQVLFEGGSPQREAARGQGMGDAAYASAEDDYVVGEYGDPVSELYASDDNGGWSDSVREPRAERKPSITRGALAD